MDLDAVTIFVEFLAFKEASILMVDRIFENADRVATIKHNYAAKVPIVFEPLTFDKFAGVKLDFSANPVFD